MEAFAHIFLAGFLVLVANFLSVEAMSLSAPMLNVAKCDLMMIGMATLSHFQKIAPWIMCSDATLLGAPFSIAAISSSLHPIIESLRRLASYLRCLHAYNPIYLLSNCLAIPMRRSSPSWKARSKLEEFDEIVRLLLQSISTMEESLWSPAILVVSRQGGFLVAFCSLICGWD